MANIKQSRRRERTAEPKDDLEQATIDLARVTRVMAGGKRMRFRACVALGDHKGRVGVGLAKAADVTGAVNKAATQARKHLHTVPLVDETIPYPVTTKYGAARLLLKPAPKGTGIKAGGAVRTILELAGVGNVVSKILGSSNKVNNVMAALHGIDALWRIPVVKKAKAAEGEKVPAKAIA